MDHVQTLSFREFLKDIQLVITSPLRRFALIQERGASWGSWLLLLVPSYLAFFYVGALYFAHEPFPGYAFLPPVLTAVVAVYLKIFSIHIWAHVFQRRQPPGTPLGTFSGLLRVFGYTQVPALMAILLAATMFLTLPQEIGRLMIQFKAVGISIMVAIAIALFVWSLILVVLAMRTVYRIRDIHIVISYILGSILMSVPAFGTMWVVATPHINFAYVQPVFSSRILRFFSADPTSSISQNTKISIHVDRLAYRLRDPVRFELVAFTSAVPNPSETGGKGGIYAGSSTGVQASIHWEDGTTVVGRLVGLPGDTVELAAGNLRINGQLWDEPYLLPENRSSLTMAFKTLQPSEYLVLPEDRNLIPSMKDDLLVMRDRLIGRWMVSRYPLGWLTFRPSVFLHARPVTPDNSSVEK